MNISLRSGPVVSILLAGMLCSCGKKEESPAPQPSAAPVAKPQAQTPPAAPTPAPAAKEAPPKIAEAKAPAPQAPAATVAEREFAGTVGGQPIIMGLAFQDEAGGGATVKGWYFLEASGSGSKLPLAGTLQDGTLTLDQSVEGKVTGSFELSVSEVGGKKNFLGAWKGLGRVLPAKITER